MHNKTFGNFISALNPALGEAYKQDRWHSVTTGKGHNIGDTTEHCWYYNGILQAMRSKNYRGTSVNISQKFG